MAHGAATRSLNNTDYLVCVLSESVFLSRLIKVLPPFIFLFFCWCCGLFLFFFPMRRYTQTFQLPRPNYFKSLGVERKKRVFSLQSRTFRRKNKRVLGQKTLNRQNTYKAFTKGAISDGINGWKSHGRYAHCAPSTGECVPLRLLPCSDPLRLVG